MHAAPKGDISGYRGPLICSYLEYFSVWQDAEKAAKKLTDEAYSRGSNDNISCIVIRFKF